MKGFIGTVIKRPVTICVLVVILLAVGVLAAADMSTNLLPDIAMPMMGITVVYPGASASSVESDVTSVVENALHTVSGLTELQTISYDNVSVCILTFDYGTNLDAKTDVIEDMFKTLTLPDACNDPVIVQVDMNSSAAATVALYNTDGDIDKLTADAEELRKLFGGIEGVGSVSVVGSPERRVEITALEGLDITSLLLVQALTNENLDLPLGTVMSDGSVVAIRNASDATSVLEIMRIPAKLQLPMSVFTELSAVKQAVIAYSTCTMSEFEDYVQKALDAREVITEMETMTADELADRQNSLASVKTLMATVRGNTAQSLQLMWGTINRIISDEAFLAMSEEDLQVLADQYGVSVDFLKWVQDGSKDGTIKGDWEKLVEFRRIFPLADTDGNGDIDGQDITYADFAMLFQNGGTVTKSVADSQTGEVSDKQFTFEGLDILHAHNEQCGYPTTPCDKKTFTAEEAEDVCRFADSVNTVAYDDIVTTVRQAEENGEQAEITDAQFAALFINTAAGGDFAALMSPQAIGLLRRDDFETKIIAVLREAKERHVDESGDAVYANGFVYTEDEDGRAVGAGGYFIDNFGRLTDADGNYVDASGNKLALSEAQLAEYYYTLGEYVIFTDEQLLKLYADLGIDNGMGIELTPDTVRFLRICNFSAAVETDGTGTLLVPLAYIGRVADTVNETAFAQYNDFLSVTVEVYTVGGANTTAVVDSVKKIIASASVESKILLLDDKAEFINDSISNVLGSIIIGGVLAVLVIYLFVRKIGSSLVISITMPLSVLVAVTCLWAMNISLNMVSLGGLAVGIGMLVDNSIVVLESITKRRDKGESVYDSCLNGTREVAGSLLASTLTNICVFFPILFARGLTREIFYDLVWAVMFSIVMSLAVALTVIPTLYHLIYKNPKKQRVRKNKDGTVTVLPSRESKEPRAAAADKTPKKDKKRKKRAPGAIVAKGENAYGTILKKALSHRGWVCVTALVLFTSSVLLVFTTGTDFLPSVDKGLIEVNISYDSSATLEKAKQLALTAADRIKNIEGEEIEYVSVTVGKQGLLATEITGKLRVQLGQANKDTGNAAQKIRSALEGMEVKSVSVTEMDGVVAEVTSGMSGMSVTLLGPDIDVLSEISAQVAEKLAQTENIVSVTDNAAGKTEQVSFKFDKYACAEKGVDYQNAVLMLRVGLSGYTAANVRLDENSTEVVVSFAEQSASDVDKLLGLAVGFDGGGAVTVEDVLLKDGSGNAEGTGIIRDSVVSVINKKDGVFLTTVDVESYGADTGTVSKRINAAVEEVLRGYDGYSYQQGGVSGYLTDAFNGLVVSLVAAFILLYGVMACQFESLLKPFIVIMSIPFSFTGGFIALAATGTTLNVVSFVGLIMLMGVIVNGAIVMIDKIDMLIAEGADPREAVIEGCKSRLRPIIMTTLTTVLALVPLALGLGDGGELMQPMGIVVLGGLLLGTAVTLVLIPCFYCLIKKIRYPSKGKAACSDGDTTPAVISGTDAAESGNNGVQCVCGDGLTDAAAAEKEERKEEDGNKS